MIPQELLDKYDIADKSFYDSEVDYYRTFLLQTDHIPNKIIEAQALGEPSEDYTEILRWRQFARDEINRLQN